MVQGLIGKKIGMTQVYKEDGTPEAVTVIEAGPCLVTQIKTAEKEGYNAVQVGFGQAKRLSKPLKGHLGETGSFKYLREFEADNVSSLKIGQVVDVTIFEKGSLVDVTGISKGKGFAGVVKRYHFRGGPKTHGQSDRLRAPGSIGSTTFPGRVWKGQRMAGHMGNRRVTQKDLRVVRADPQKNLLLVRGAVPGARNSVLLIQKTRQGK